MAIIAESHLTPEAKAGIHDLLGTDVDISDAEIASWADQIKRERRATADWHYVNIPIDSPRFDPKRDGKKRENVVEKIDDQAAIIANPKADREVRAEAVKWVVHLVGDLHQPLHCADRNKDKGGNAILVRYLDKQTKPPNLHAVWDGIMLRDWLKGSRVADHAAKLDAATGDKDRKAWSGGSATDWANETVLIARDYVYKGVSEVPAGGGEMPRLDQA